MMKKILINASAAKTGGALTILESYLNSDLNSDFTYYLLSPYEPKVTKTNIVWIKKETNGISTMLFTLFFSYYYYFRLGCTRCISFNNFNFIFSSKGKVTYFHNLLILNSLGFRYKLIRFILKFLNQNESLYIFQTSYVKELFKNNINDASISIVCWPGISMSYVNKGLKIGQSHYNLKLVVPIADIRLQHKNFKLIMDLAKNIQNVLLIVPDNKPNGLDFIPGNITFIGKKDRDELLSLISISDGVLISSIYETLCLPIFESIYLGKQSFVYEQPYLNAIISDIGNIDNLHKFCNLNDLNIKLALKCKVLSNKTKDIISVGNWEF